MRLRPARRPLARLLSPTGFRPRPLPPPSFGRVGALVGGLVAVALAGGPWTMPATAQDVRVVVEESSDPDRVCIAHRGASGDYPEHTLLAYDKAIAAGAHYVEQDLAFTSDGALVCLHDDTLERTTNVAEVFPDRFFKADNPSGRIKKTWRAVDFTLEEIKRLDAGSWFDPSFEGERVPTFQEAIDLVKGRAGIYPELKSPSFYRRQGFRMEEEVARILAENGLDTPEKRAEARTPVFVQCFEPEPLKNFHRLTGGAYPLVQLVTDAQARGLLNDVSLSQVAKYAAGVGPSISILEKDPSRIEAIHRLGMKIHPYTVSWKRLPDRFEDLTEWSEHLLATVGVDGLFTDNPDLFPHGR